jgi:hypothetical protein
MERIWIECQREREHTTPADVFEAGLISVPPRAVEQAPMLRAMHHSCEKQKDLRMSGPDQSSTLPPLPVFGSAAAPSCVRWRAVPFHLPLQLPAPSSSATGIQPTRATRGQQ